MRNLHVPLALLERGLVATLVLIGTGATPLKIPVTSPAPAPAVQTGLQPTFPIDTRAFKTFRDYYSTSVQRKVLTAYKMRKGMASYAVNKLTPEQCHAYEDGQTAIIYVPAGYDGSGPFGVYLHNSPSKQGIRPSPSWQTLMDKLHLIYISPNGGGNEVADLRRVVLALDSLASVKQHYLINDERVYVGGLSGGGYVGMVCQMFYPELFHGAISHAAQSYLPVGSKTGHFAGLSITDIKSSPRNQRKWVVISGENDKNYREILDTSKDWAHAHMPYKFIDAPNMGHQNASAEALEEALLWIGADHGLPVGKTASANSSNAALASKVDAAADPTARFAEEDPDALIINCFSKKVIWTGLWSESNKALFQGRPTLFTRQPGAAAKFPLEMKAGTRATVSVYMHPDGQRYGDPKMKVSVCHNGKLDDFSLDCSKNRTGWQELGCFEFSGKAGEYVLISRVSPESEDIATRAIAMKAKVVPPTAGTK